MIDLIETPAPVILPDSRSVAAHVERSTGAHLSDIIEDLFRSSAGLAHPSVVEREEQLASAQDIFEVGFLFEEAMRARDMAAYPGRYINIGEVECDGIIGTLDVLDLNFCGTGNRAVPDYKTTRINIDNITESVSWAKWWLRIQGYCYMTKSRIGVVRGLFLRGNYREIMSAQRSWYQVYSVATLQQSWGLIRSHAKRMGVI